MGFSCGNQRKQLGGAVLVLCLFILIHSQVLLYHTSLDRAVESLKSDYHLKNNRCVNIDFLKMFVVCPANENVNITSNSLRK